jgi:hypothetical protein
MGWTQLTHRPVVGRAVREIVSDPARSDELIARLARCSPTTVASARQRLESIGLVEHVPAPQRLARPRVQPSRTRDAIALLGPSATPRQVADAAQVSMAAAWKALSKVRPKLADAAAATDALSVVITAQPVQTADAAAATDAIAISKELNPADAAAATDALRTTASAICERCGGTFTFTPRRNAPPRTWCGQGCKRAGSNPSASYPPALPAFPPPPHFAKGLCTHVPASQATWWTSSEPALREAARSICEVCPILYQCAEWSLSLPVTDTAIYGAMSTHQRLALKREMRRR